MKVSESIHLARAAITILKWKMNAKKFNFDYKPGVKNPKFMSARQAIALIPDDACLMGMGMTASARPAVLWSAINERFKRTGSPKNLTVITAGGAGGRGILPGSVEEVGLEGLTTTFISGHHETARAMLDLAHRGHCTLSVLPQGVIAHLAEAQGKGADMVITKVGLGTFMDPRVGTGSQVEPGKGEQFVSVEGDLLKYRIPRVTAAVVIAAAADENGNIYMKNAPIYSEARESVLAASRNGGVSIVTVASIIPKDEKNIYIKAEHVSAIVVCPKNEITATVPQLMPWKELLPGNGGNIEKASKKITYRNRIIKADPERDDSDYVMARQAAKIFSHIAHPESHCVIGYGLPQMVSREVVNAGIGDKLTFMLETGIYGGIPAPGFFFGLAYHPKKLISSAEMFHIIDRDLDVTILGMLQADEEGNVNVSKKGTGAKNYIGPGGFLNLVANARNIIFTGGFTAKSKVAVENGKVKVLEPGLPKFVKKVGEITFSAAEALRAGKKVYYVTPLCVLKLTKKGLELQSIAPGVDLKKDILACSDARIIVPDKNNIPLFDHAVITGKNFKLSWKK